jgi:predicted Zn-dependent protease with MMP-like domain
VGLHHHRPAGGREHAAGCTAAGAVNRRAERLARYADARRRSAPRTSLKAFKVLVAEALDALPGYIQERLENVAVVVEERSRPGDGRAEELLGLYEGVNRLDRASGYHLVTPDRITLFWRPIIEEVGRGGPEAIRREIRKTVIHEFAHHFGMDDAELERLGG